MAESAQVRIYWKVKAQNSNLNCRHMSKVKTKVEGDSSVMTYTGHTVLQTLIRCHFSPDHTTGQSLIYTGCAAGRVVVYDLLTGEIVKVEIYSI